MLDAISQKNHNVLSFEGWRVAFRHSRDPQPSDRIENQADQTLAYSQPRPTKVVLDPISWEQAQAPSDNHFILVWAPFEAAARVAVESEVEDWLGREDSQLSSKTIRASIRTARIYWRKTKAVIFCDKELVDDVRDAVLRFTLCQRALAELEDAVGAFWPRVEEDYCPTSQPGNNPSQNCFVRSRQTALEAKSMKAAYLRICLAAEQNDCVPCDASRRLFEELALNGVFHEKLEALDGPVEFLFDCSAETHGRWFDLMNSLKERKYYSIEIVMESIIIILLIIGLLKNF